MSNNVWLITGAGRGTGVDLAKADLAAGCNTERINRVLGTSENLLPVQLNGTKPKDAKAAVDTLGLLNLLVVAYLL